MTTTWIGEFTARSAIQSSSDSHPAFVPQLLSHITHNMRHVADNDLFNLDAIGVSADHQDKIFSGNFARLFA